MPSYSAPWRAQKIEAIGLMVKIIARYPENKNFYFTDIPIRDSVISSSNASIGLAAAIVSTNIGVSDVGDDDCTIAIRNLIYADAMGNDQSSYGGLVDLMAHFSLIGCGAEVFQYGRGAYPGAGLITEKRSIYTGYVANVTDLTPTTLTLQLTRALPYERGVCTMWTCGGNGIRGKTWPFPLDRLPEQSKGLALPLRLGTPFYYPQRNGMDMSNWYNEGGLWGRAAEMLRVFPGFSFVPCRFAEDGRNDPTGNPFFRWASQEQPGFLDAYSWSIPVARVYAKSGDAIAEWNQSYALNDPGARALGFYTGYAPSERDFKSFIIPLAIPAPVYPNVQWKNAVDGKPDTWMTLDGNLGSQYRKIRFRIPAIGDRGTVRAESGGIKLYVLTLGGTPPGATVPAAGTFKLGIKDPYPSDNWFHGPTDYQPDSLSCNLTALQAATGTYQAINDFYPDYRLWTGTAWQRWDFRASGETDAGNSENLIYAGPTAVGKPFDIGIEVAAGNNVVHIAFVGIQMWYYEGSDSFVPYERKKLSNKWYSKYKRMWSSWKPKEEREQRGGRRNLWDRSVANREVDDEDEAVDPEQVYISHPGYYDNLQSYQPNVGWLDTPGGIINYLVERYSNPREQYIVAGATSFGTVAYFNAIMNEWAKLSWTPSGVGFRIANFWNYDASSNRLDDVLRRIFSELPGMPRRGLTNAGLPALIATSYSTALSPGSDSKHSAIETDGGISCHDAMLGDKNNIPRVELMNSDVNQVVYDIEIHYQYDPVRRKYGAIARCNPEIEDDGFGAAWPATPGGVSAKDLCGLSQSIYAPDTTNYSRGKKIIKAQYLWDPWTAVALGTWILWRYWRVYATLRFVGSLACQDILPGQIIKFKDDVRTIGGLSCSRPFQHPGTGLRPTWTNVYWHVMSSERIDDGETVMYQIAAMEHLNNDVGVGVLHGGPVLTAVGEGFDV